MIDGYCASQFVAVRDALVENLSDDLEIGEAIAISVAGRLVVDLWGGYRDAGGAQPWAEDTLVCIFSVGKPIAALPLLRLIDRGEVDLQAPVAAYWPEYGAAGKERTTVDDVVSHLAGIPGVSSLPSGCAYNWDKMIKGIETQIPLWKPGSTGCYHTFTYGHLVGELARRVTGKPIDQLVREEIANPLGVDLAFGLDPDQLQRCATVSATPGDPLLAAIRDRSLLIGQCWSALPFGEGEEDFNTTAFRTSVMPSINGHASARALATLYANLAGVDTTNTPALLSQKGREMMTTERWHGVDVLGLNNRMARGVRLSNAYSPFNGNPRSFGHGGIGGAVGFADPDAQIGLGFVTNRLVPGPGMSPYAQRLINALSASL
ncbi:serine hydrolase domain-containing protein [Candidatus Entotheonella palauensis]|uniref:serine hydrolase domain-containing protein n=1 Tax=Candidatus Entotheonella palauensis TaxID=93172 RepID=UPI0015C42EF3|nr:serine hydrolase domain-containing protein [Candidatus Entotheonella palauensis]